MFAFLTRETLQSCRLFLTIGLAVLAVGATDGVHVFQALKNGGLADPAPASNREAQEFAAAGAHRAGAFRPGRRESMT